MAFLNFLIGILVLFFLGGFFISKNKNLTERFLEAIIISLSVNILIGLALAVFGIFNSFFLWISLIFFIIISLILFLKNQGFKIESFLFKLDKIEALSLIIAFIVIFFLVFNVHYTLIGNPENFKRAETKYYPFPYHLDEWSHIAQARYILDEGRLPFENPYFYKFKSIKRFDFELGFHVFLAEYFILTGVNPILHFQFLPALFTALSAMFLYIFVKKIHGKIAGIIALIFFTSIKSNINILGHWFFTPSSFIVLFLFAAFYFLSKKSIILLDLTIVASAFVYPPVTFFIIISYLFYVFKNKYFFYLISSITILVFYIIFLFRMPYIFELLSKALFFEGWAFGFEFQNVDFSLVLLTFGLYGFFSKIMDKRYQFLTAFTTLNILMVIIYLIFSFTVIIPIVRVTYYLQIVLSIFAAIGIVNLINFASNSGKIYKNFLTFVILLTVFLIQFYNYYSIGNERYFIYEIIDQKKYDAMPVLSDRDKLVMSDPLTSIAIYPISGNNVVSILSSNLGGGNGSVVYQFNTAEDCSLQKSILDNVSYIRNDGYFIFFNRPLNCRFYNKIYEEENIFIYNYSSLSK